MPTMEDVRKAGEQARATVTEVFDQARTPLLAAVGAGELVGQAVRDVVTKARTQINHRVGDAKSVVDELPTDVDGLRAKLDPAELNKLVEQYTDAALKFYRGLAEHGEKAVRKLRSQPQVKRAVEQFDQAVETASHRAESAVEDARELADEVLGRVVRRNRPTTERAAAEKDLKGTVVDAEPAPEAPSTTRKTTGRTTTTKKTTAAKSQTTRKSTEG